MDVNLHSAVMKVMYRKEHRLVVECEYPPSTLMGSLDQAKVSN